jgi:hypothetical protein
MPKKKSNRINLDKYYTPVDTAKYCIEKTYTIIGKDNISHVIEPSAGNGNFSKQIPNVDAYDIEPEDPSITKQDYLNLNIDYMPNRLIIGNPPFGERMALAQKFFKHSVLLGDYIAFILPISQLWNSNSMFEFELIHSEDLGNVIYSDRKLKCCFNIYKRPASGLNKRPVNKLKSVQIIRQDSKGYDTCIEDIRMCYWGNGSAGKILTTDEHYSGEYKLKIDPEYRDKVIDVLTNIDWREELNCIAMLKIQQFHVINILKKYVPGIK